MNIFSVLFISILIFSPCFAKKVLYYSEENGIMWVEESELSKIKQRKPQKAPQPTAPVKEQPTRTEKMQRDHKTYYKIGQRYFNNGDYAEALRYFENAYKLKHEPEYYLFIAKCHRKLGQPKRMMFVLESILQLYRESEVADDALFEMALYYETIQDYSHAIQKYKMLTEQYPYGVSITNQQGFREVAREQIAIMEQETAHLLDKAEIQKGPLFARIKNFQKKYNLPVTGLPDLQTIQILLEIRTKIEEAHRIRQTQKQMIVKLRRWGIAGLSVLLINFIWAIVHWRAIAERQQRIEILQKSVEAL